MAIESPMSNFNRKNPYVIQAKQQYEILMREYEQVSRTIITYGTLVLLGFVIALGVTIYTSNLKDIIVLTSILLLSLYITYRYICMTIKDSVNNDIDHMISMESNEILNISVEYVQELLYKLHECIGKVQTCTYWYKRYCIISFIILILIMIIKL